MAADNDVLHAQRQHCVLNGGGHPAHHLAVSRHHIANVAVDEQVAWRALSDQLRHHPRVGAGDKHRARVLCGGELFEQVFLLWKDFAAKALETINDGLQGFLGTLSACTSLQRNQLMLVWHVCDL